MSKYQYTGPVDCTARIDAGKLKDKTAIVTGGANGIGEAFVRALVDAGAYVCFGDFNAEQGQKLSQELPRTRFVRCDVREWDDQVELFGQAKAFSPTGTIAYVVVNAGLLRPDTVFYVNESKPTKPDLSVLDVNIVGSMYTIKLALFHFVQQNGSEAQPQDDTCLVLMGSSASYLDVPRAPQYSASKWALRGVMHSLRRTAYYYGTRVNMIAPWYVKSTMVSEEAFAKIRATGTEFGEIKDVQKCLLRILSDTTITGKSFMVGPRKWAEQGHWDLELDDFSAKAGTDFMQRVQQEQMWSAPVESGLFMDSH